MLPFDDRTAAAVNKKLAAVLEIADRYWEDRPDGPDPVKSSEFNELRQQAVEDMAAALQVIAAVKPQGLAAMVEIGLAQALECEEAGVSASYASFLRDNALILVDSLIDEITGTDMADAVAAEHYEEYEKLAVELRGLWPRRRAECTGLLRLFTEISAKALKSAAEILSEWDHDSDPNDWVDKAEAIEAVIGPVNAAVLSCLPHLK